MQTTASFVSVLCVGIFVGNYPTKPNQPYVDQAGLKVVATVTMSICSPLMSFGSLASGMRVELLRDAGVVLGLSFANTFCCLLIGWLISVIIRGHMFGGTAIIIITMMQ